MRNTRESQRTVQNRGNSKFGRTIIAGLAALVLLGVGNSNVDAQYSDVVMSQNPSLYWQLNDSSGPTATALAGSNGVYGSDVLFGQNPVRQCGTRSIGLSKDSDAHVLLESANIFAFINNSVSFWVQGEDLSTSYLFGYAAVNSGPSDPPDEPNEFSMSSINGSLRVIMGGSQVLDFPGISVLDGARHHVGISYRQNNPPNDDLKIYIDGVMVAGSGTQVILSPRHTNGKLVIGQDFDSATPPYQFEGTFEGLNGRISDFAAWPRELSAAEFAAQFAAEQSGPPGNDDYANLFSIDNTYLPTTDDGCRNTGATNESGEISGTTGAASVWWTFEVPIDGTLSVDTFGSDFDTTLDIYTDPGNGGGVSDLNLVAFNIDAINGGDQSKIELEGFAGQVFKIRVAGANSEEGNIVLNVTVFPHNDDLATSTFVFNDSFPTTNFGSNIGATVEPGEQNLGNLGSTVWWTVVAPHAGTFTIDTFGSGFDTVLHVYEPTTGNIEDMILVAENDDFGSSASQVSFDAPSAGTSYEIRVSGYDFKDGNGPEQGEVTLNVDFEGNVIFDNGVTQANGTNHFTSDSQQVLAAGIQLTECQRVTQVKWLGAYFNLAAPPATDNFQINIYPDDNGSPASGAPLATFDVGNDVNRTESVTNQFEYTADIDGTILKADTTYWVTIHDQDPGVPDFVWLNQIGVTSDFAFSLNGGTNWTASNDRLLSLVLVGEDPTTTNDDWSDTLDIGGSFPSTVSGNNFGATTQADEQLLNDPPVGSTVWWYVYASDDGTMTIDTRGSDFDTVLHVFEHAIDFNDLIPVTFNDDIDSVNRQSEVTFTATQGVCYEIRVGGYSGEQGCIDLNTDFEPFPDPVNVVPDSLNILNGTLAVGGFEELATSDNSDLSIRRSNSDVFSQVIFELTSQSPTMSPNTLSFTIEASVFSRSRVTQTIDLFDYVAGTYVQLNSVDARRFVDSVETADASGDLSRFVDQTTGEMKARVRFVSPDIRQRFTANTDLVTWTIR